MDFQTLIVAALSSGVVGLVVGYFLNRRFEVAKAELQETIRRQAAIFDHQKEALLRISEMSYRLRNELRDAAGPSSELPGRVLQDIEPAQAAFNEALYNSRAILPEHAFSLAHDLKAPIHSTLLLLPSIRSCQAEGRGVPIRYKRELAAELKEVEEQFRSFVELCRRHLGWATAHLNSH